MAKVEDLGFCDGNCNECIVIRSRAVSFVLESLYSAFGDKAYKIIQESCPNMTCCADCCIDDFSHVKDCEISKASTNFLEELDIDKIV